MDYSNTYNPDWTYSTAHTANFDAATTAVVVIMLLFMFVLFVASYAITAFLLGRIFKKAGVEQWIAWVPFYNIWKGLEIGGQPGFWSILTVIPFVNIVAWIFVYISAFNIGKKLGKQDWFVLFAIFLPLVWLIWLAFDDSKWPGVKTVAAKSVAAETKKPAPRKKA